MPTCLKDLALKENYRTTKDNVVKDFYIPCLKVSQKFTRAVGYFNSSAFEHAMEGLEAFLESQGKLRLIVSPKLTQSDINEIELGYEARAKSAELDFQTALKEMNKETCGILACLIASGRLDIKIALLDGPHGFFHDKLGLFEDGENQVAFSGSGNETTGGLIMNAESYDVFTSWGPAKIYAENKIQQLEDLWANKEPGMQVQSFTDVSKELLEPYLPPNWQNGIGRGTETKSKPKKFGELSDLSIRDYQDQAIENWFANGKRGVISFATGTGKTVTGIELARRCVERSEADLIVITTPLRDISHQWIKQIQGDFGGEVLEAFGSKAEWLPKAYRELTNDLVTGKKTRIWVTVNASLHSEECIELLKKAAGQNRNILFIADEAHHMGSESALENIKQIDAEMRLGLSATPSRYGDPDGTEELFSWFGEQIEPVKTVAWAIENQHLCKYVYKLSKVYLTEDESKEVNELWDPVSKAIAENRSKEFIQKARMDANKTRAKTIDQVQAKLTWLTESIMEIPPGDRTHILAYCKSTRVAIEEDDEESIRMVELISSLIKDKGISASPYTSREGMRRKRILEEFKQGSLQCLVAIKCLDEGVDIPAARNAIMHGSSRNPREFVQRRGRVLRNAPGKEHATIYDCIPLPQDCSLASEQELEAIRKELSRNYEFAKSAVNKEECMDLIEGILFEYALGSLDEITKETT